VELLLQLQGLVARVGGPLPFSLTVLIHCIWKATNGSIPVKQTKRCRQWLCG
jgi:hypothetical protein